MDTLSLGINFIGKLPQGMHSNDNQFSDNSIRNSKSTDVVNFSPEFIPENFRDFTLKEINNPYQWKNEGGDKPELLLMPVRNHFEM